MSQQILDERIVRLNYMTFGPGLVRMVMMFGILRILVLVGVAFGENLRIVVYTEQLVGRVNPLVFGNNLLGYDPAKVADWTHYYVGYSNYGGGIWDPKKKEPLQEVIELGKGAGITIARFPGGTGSSFYEWKKTIGPYEERPSFLYGLDEFLKTCEEMGAKAIITLPYFTGSIQDAADLVEYLNIPDDGKNAGGGIDWARRRAENGHALPYNVHFFELGNEVNFGVRNKGVSGVLPTSYARDYKRYRQAMKGVDPSIQVGVSTVNTLAAGGVSAWNEKLFSLAGHEIDFLVEHTYRPGYTSPFAPSDLAKSLETILGSLTQIEADYRNLSRQFQVMAGGRQVPIAVTEYNCRFLQNEPVRFRHSLGSALFNAGLLQIFLKPENNILMANYWHFANGFWGMVKNDLFAKGEGTYTKRPNYYVFEMFNKHFGSDLINVDVSDTSKNLPARQSQNLLLNTQWKIKRVKGARAQIEEDHVEVVFEGGRDINYGHIYKRVKIKPATSYRLSGYLSSDNLEDNEGVCLSIQDGRGWEKVKSNASTRRVWGKKDQVFVETEYSTLSDATDVLVQVRRIGGLGPIRGKVSIDNVRLVEIIAPESGGKEITTSISSSRSTNGEIFYLIVLNKSLNNEIGSHISLDKGMLPDVVKGWTLYDSDVWATNEEEHDRIRIREKKIKTDGSQVLHYKFPPHSLTSLEFRAR